MPYSVEIRKVLKSGRTYSHEAVNYDGTNALMPDEVIRSVRIDDASVDPADLFATIGRKCKIEATAYGNLGWISSTNSDDLSHPDYPEWYPYMFIVRRERDDSLNSVIFIGALKKTNYSVNSASASETMYLSDAVDIWVDLVKKDSGWRYVPEDGYWGITDIPDIIGSIMQKWPLMSNVGSSGVNEFYQLSDINVIYPGYSATDYDQMLYEAQNSQNVSGLSAHSYIWRTPLREIQVVLYIKYQKGNAFYAQGYRMWFNGDDPFNLIREAAYIGGTREGLISPSLTGLGYLMYFNGILPSSEVIGTDLSFYTFGETYVTATGNVVLLSGKYYPSRQRFKDRESDANIVKALLVCNMATLSSTLNPWPGDTATSSIRFRSIINPSININSEEVIPSKHFTAGEITHYQKKGILYSDQMFNALGVLIDGDFKKSLLPSLYANLISVFRYTYTFSSHYTTQGVSTMSIGDIIWTSQTNGNMIITAISDQDDNGLITFTAVGGY